MDDKDLIYSNMLDRLRKMEPVLDGAEALTDTILQRVKQTIAWQGQVRRMRISGIVSGVAASALVCLLAYETWKYPVSPIENYSMVEGTSLEIMYPEKLNDRKKTEIIKNRIKSKENQRAQKERLTAVLMTGNKIIN